MLNFILGVITAYLALAFLVFLEMFVIKRYKTMIVKSMTDWIDQKTKPKGAIINAKSDAELAREHVIEENSKQGLITKAEELNDDWNL